MTPEKYAKELRKVVVAHLLQSEGKLRAEAEERRASAIRMRTDADAADVAPQPDTNGIVRLRVEADSQDDVANTVDREADALRARVAVIEGWGGNVSKPPEPVKTHEQQMDDVAATVLAALALVTDQAHHTVLVDLAGLVTDWPNWSFVSWADRVTRGIEAVAWPVGAAAEYAQSALRAIAKLRLHSDPA